MRDRVAELKADLAREEAACEAAKKSRAHARDRIAYHREALRAQYAARDGANDVIRVCQVEIRRLKREIARAERSR